MILAISNVLSEADVAALRNGLAQAAFAPGEDTAGWSVSLVKSNLQAAESPQVEAMRSLVQGADPFAVVGAARGGIRDDEIPF